MLSSRVKLAVCMPSVLLEGLVVHQLLYVTCGLVCVWWVGSIRAHDRNSASQIRFIPAEEVVHGAWRTFTDQCWLRQPIDSSVILFGLEQTVFAPWKNIPSMILLRLFVDRTSNAQPCCGSRRFLLDHSDPCGLTTVR